MDKVGDEPGRIKAEQKPLDDAKHEGSGQRGRQPEDVGVYHDEEGHRLYVRDIHERELHDVQAGAQNGDQDELFDEISRFRQEGLVSPFDLTDEVDVTVFEFQRGSAESSAGQRLVAEGRCDGVIGDILILVDVGV